MSGRNNPGAPSKISVKATTATVPTTSSPVVISFRRNCISGAFQNRAFGASAQELSDDRVGGLSKLCGIGFFNDLALIQHSHARSDAKGAVHLVRDRDRGGAGLFAQADN